MADRSARHDFLVTGTLAVVCSLLVSLTAVGLGERQQRNRELDRKRNILVVTDRYDPAVSIEDSFAEIEARLVDLETGAYVDEGEALADYNQRLATSSPDLSSSVPTKVDIAGISRKEKYSWVYLVNNGETLEQVVLPIRGQGLFSTLYAYLALDADLETVRGITFYEHGETAGLGAEVENPAWTALWPGKRLYDDGGGVKLQVIKGVVDPSAANAAYQVDGLSGATMTSSGVTNLLSFWFGDEGFGPYLRELGEEGNVSG